MLKDPQHELEERRRGVQRSMTFAWQVLAVAVALIILANLADRYQRVFGYYSTPWWAEVMGGLGMLGLLGFVLALRHAWRKRRRYKNLQEGTCRNMPLDITDRFMFIKLLPGEEGPLELRYFVITPEGTWRLAEDKLEYFQKLQPGMHIKASVIEGKLTREIVDLELPPTPVPAPDITPTTVTDKVASEVKITGYSNNDYHLNKLHLFKEVRYYLLIDNKPILVDEPTFHKTPLNSTYIVPVPEEDNSGVLGAFNKFVNNSD